MHTRISNCYSNVLKALFTQRDQLIYQLRSGSDDRQSALWIRRLGGCSGLKWRRYIQEHSLYVMCHNLITFGSDDIAPNRIDTGEWWFLNFSVDFSSIRTYRKYRSKIIDTHGTRNMYEFKKSVSCKLANWEIYPLIEWCNCLVFFRYSKTGLKQLFILIFTPVDVVYRV